MAMLVKKGWRSVLQNTSDVLLLRRGIVNKQHEQRRAMSRLFVGGLAFRTDEDGLRDAFAKHGELIDARIVTDRETGRSRGFGFVTYLSEEEADTARTKMHGQFLDGRVIRVDRATPRPPPPPLPDNLPPLPPELAQGLDDNNSNSWGDITSPIAPVPQNATHSDSGGSPAVTSPYANPSSGPGSSSGFSPGANSGLPDISSLASGSSNSSSYSDIGSLGASPGTSSNFPDVSSFGSPSAVPIPAPPPSQPSSSSPSFNFSNLGLSDLPSPSSNPLPRSRPPRIRPSMMSDYEFGYHMSETAKFPYNTNFNTGIPRPKGPEFEFDFTEFELAKAKEDAELAKTQEAAELAKAQEAAELAKAQEAAELAKAQEGAELGKAQEAAELAKAQEATQSA